MNLKGFASDIYLGIGHGTPFTGRAVPELSIGTGTKSFYIGAASSGAESKLATENAYQLACYSMWSPGKFSNLVLNAGFGFGAYYSEAFYRESEIIAEKKSTAMTLGPAVRFVLELWGPFIITLDSIMGIKDIHPLLINFQDVTRFSVGVVF